MADPFRCPACGFACDNPEHLHHPCHAADGHEIVEPHDHAHEGCYSAMEGGMRRFYRFVLASLRALPEDKRMLYSGAMEGLVAGSTELCHCVIGVVLPKHVLGVVGRTAYLAGMAIHPEVRVWLQNVGAMKEGPERRRYSDTREGLALQELQTANDRYPSGVNNGGNNEATCRARYAYMVERLEWLITQEVG